MWTTVKEMLKSKKALMALVSATVWIAGKAGLHLDNATLLGAVTPLWTYVLGQGIADHGKEAAKISAAGE
jgi:hypothetical protein